MAGQVRVAAVVVGWSCWPAWWRAVTTRSSPLRRATSRRPLACAGRLGRRREARATGR